MTSRWSMCQRTRLRAGSSSAPIVTTILVATGLCACAPATTPTPARPEPTVRVIARFAPDVVDPLDPAFLARLAGFAHVTRIDPIRAMSGAAYVLQVGCGDPGSPQEAADPCASAVARLKGSTAVLGVEVDRRERLQ